MQRIVLSVMCCFISFGLLWAGGPPSYGYDRPLSPESSLHRCQRAVSQAAEKFMYRKLDAIGSCLQAVSRNLVKKNEPDAASAAQACIFRFSRIDDFEARLIEEINTKCDPSQDNVTHTLGDILGEGAGVLEPLQATNLNAYCASFGGDGSIDSLIEWSSCLAEASECAVDSAIAAQFPRALEWMEWVGPEMAASHGNPDRIAEAVAALAAVEAAIEGATNDNLPEISCGPSAYVPAEPVADPTCPCSFDVALFPPAPPVAIPPGEGTVFCAVTRASDAISASLSRDLAVRRQIVPFPPVVLASSTALSVDASGCSAVVTSSGTVEFLPTLTPVTTHSNISGPMSDEERTACIADIVAIAPVCP